MAPPSSLMNSDSQQMQSFRNDYVIYCIQCSLAYLFLPLLRIQFHYHNLDVIHGSIYDLLLHDDTYTVDVLCGPKNKYNTTQNMSLQGIPDMKRRRNSPGAALQNCPVLGGCSYITGLARTCVSWTICSVLCLCIAASSISNLKLSSTLV